MRMKKIGIFLALTAMLLLGVGNALALTSCAGYTYTTGNADGSDFFNVGSTISNLTPMTSTATTDRLFTGLSFMTPRLNFTRNVTDFVVGQAKNGLSALAWRSVGGPNVIILQIKNVTTILDVSNYSLQATATGVWAVNWTDGKWAGIDLNVTYNKTFVKNVDDLVTGPSSIYTSAIVSNFLVTNVATAAYGDDASFRLNNESLGNAITGQNWAVGWTYSERTCAASGVDQSSISGINSVKTIAFGALALLGVMLIIMAAWGLIKVVEQGSFDFTALAGLIIGGGIVLMLGFVILYFVGKALIG